MANIGEQQLQSRTERLRQLISESLVGLAFWVRGKDAGPTALQATTLQATAEELQHAKRQCQPTNDGVFETDVLVKRVMEFVGPDQYLFSASISRSCRQMQIVLSYKRAEGSKKAKLRTSFAAALASPARLQWAFGSGLKQKDKYYKPLQLVQTAMKVSSDAAAVLGLLNVQSLKKVDQQEASKLCATAAERCDLELLKWLHTHDRAWDAKTCSWAAFKGRLDMLQWAREQGCPWDKKTCSNAAWQCHLHILQWARANGCPWNRIRVLELAAHWAGVDMLEWLQHNSGEPWSDEDKAKMLARSGRSFSPAAMKWLRDRGAAWPSSFVATFFSSNKETSVCWTVPNLKWALANGCPWGEWQCQQFAPNLYTVPQAVNKKNAIEVFAWAHKNGCSCTCNDSSNSSEDN
jgi:hypothetical protein